MSNSCHHQLIYDVILMKIQNYLTNILQVTDFSNESLILFQ